MASAYMKGGTWFARFKDADGEWRKRATKARTRGEAMKLAVALEARAERQALGLEPREAPDTALTLGQLCEWWLDHRAPDSSRSRERSRLGKHVIRQPLGKEPVASLRPGAIEDRLRQMVREEGLSAVYANGLRRVLHTVFVKARRAGKWTGPNPLEQVEKLPEVRRSYVTLRPDEIPELLAAVPLQWRPMFAAAVYTGMRKGELCGLRKADVDLAAGTITVARSYGNETTKGRRTEVLPIAPALVPYLETARGSPGPYMFPDADGNMRTEEADPQRVLRAALRRAGLVDGYIHTCRRKGCGHKERQPDRKLRRCPRCGFKLWRTGIARPLRFHDLRHSVATNLLRAGVDVHRVQRILRHRDPRTTTQIYGHLLVDDLRAAVAVLGPAPMESTPAPVESGSAPMEPLVPVVSPSAS